jgi:hypothetical protein
MTDSLQFYGGNTQFNQNYSNQNTFVPTQPITHVEVNWKSAFSSAGLPGEEPLLHGISHLKV